MNERKNFNGVLVSLACLLMVGAVSPAAHAQDILYGDIQETINHGNAGTTNPTIRAYCLGTKTCNLSTTTSLNWINSGTPAVAFNMFRLADGRLTQIGMSWAKHACCVSNSTDAVCGGVSCSASGFGLRPGCRDTYSASWNAGQSRLGARSGINAYTSQFSVVSTATGNAIFKRLQVVESDLSTAGAQYFVDGVYVCNEESQQPTQRNNASYRRVTVAPTTFNLTLQGTTQSGIPAIQAWRDHGLGANTPDPSVTIGTLDVPSEGRFWYAYKVTDVGAGNYRYDYAVYNLNSDRSGGSFSVQIPAGTFVTDVGFNAPFYHSGEPYSNAAWNSSTSSCAVTWTSPESFTQNPNSNALRWGTMYNFWFTANRPPVAGTATLGLFKPHSPQSLNVTMAAPGGCVATHGDLNGNGIIDGDDLQAFVNCVVVGATPGGDCDCANVDGLCGVDSGDVVAYANVLIGSK